MIAINVKAFVGAIPRTDSRLSAGNVASEALNCRLTSGRLDPLKGPLAVHNSPITSAIATLFRYRNLGIDSWCVWNRTVDVRRATTAQDAYNRLYWTGDGEPRMGGSADVLTGGGPFPGAFFVLGVYIPLVAPTIGVTGGAAANEDRSYVYTFVTQYGEESAPSPFKTFTGKSDGTWNLTAMEAVPPNSGTVTGVTIVTAGVAEVTLDTVRGLAVYEEVTFAAIGGITGLTGTFAITSVDTATNKIRVTSAAVAGAYTAGGTWARRAPHNLTNMKRRIYRTVGTNTDYKFVAEIAATQIFYDDSTAASLVTRAITTLFSYTPPKNGHSLCTLANGAMAMLAGNEVVLSESFMGHSWPLTNRNAMDGTPVAMVAVGNSLIVMRADGKPRVYNVTDPSTATGSDLPTYAPCASKAGVVDAGGMALCPSYDGLYAITPSGAENITGKLYRINEWRDLHPSTFVAAIQDQVYYAAHQTADGSPARVLAIDTAEIDRGVREVVATVSAVYCNPYDGELYVARNTNQVCLWDGDDTNRFLSSWKSVDFQFGPPVKFTAAQVTADFNQIVPPDTSIAAANAAILAAITNVKGGLGSVPMTNYPLGATNIQHVPDVTQNKVQFSLVRNGVTIFTKDVTSAKPFRVPSDRRAELWSVQVSSSVPVHTVTVAESLYELGRTST